VPDKAILSLRGDKVSMEGEEGVKNDLVEDALPPSIGRGVRGEIVVALERSKFDMVVYCETL